MSNQVWFTVKEVAKYLGCSKGHIYNLRNKQEIPFHKVSGIGLRFNKDEIDNWMFEGGGQ